MELLLPRKGISGDSAQVTDRMVSQFLTELESSPVDVLIIAATNRPDLLDNSILLSGKFDKKIFIGIMNGKEQRVNILSSILKDYSFDESLTYEELENLFPPNITGADFYGLASKALKVAVDRLKDTVDLYLHEQSITLKEFKTMLNSNPEEFTELTKLKVTREDFKSACNGFTASVNEQDQRNYKNLAKQYADLIIS